MLPNFDTGNRVARRKGRHAREFGREARALEANLKAGMRNPTSSEEALRSHVRGAAKERKRRAGKRYHFLIKEIGQRAMQGVLKASLRR